MKKNIFFSVVALLVMCIVTAVLFAKGKNKITEDTVDVEELDVNKRSSLKNALNHRVYITVPRREDAKY